MKTSVFPDKINVWHESCQNNSDQEGNDEELEFRHFRVSYNFYSRSLEEPDTEEPSEVV